MTRRIPSSTLVLLGGLLALAAPGHAQTQNQPSKQERQTACRDEVTRFSNMFLGDQPIAGARSGTTLNGDQKNTLRGMLDDARAAASRGDTDGCLNHLREARGMVREIGVGGRPGSLGQGGTAGGTGGAGGSTGSSSAPRGATGPGTSPGTGPGTGTGTGSVGGGTGGSMGSGAGGGASSGGGASGASGGGGGGSGGGGGG